MDIKESLSLFGLNEKEQQTYLVLLKKGWSTVLQLARVVEMKRPTLYRILESLTKKGVVEVQIDDKTTYYNASDPKQFESMVIREETKAKNLRGVYETLNLSLKTLAEISAGETSVRFYRGLRGLEHLEWKKCEKPGIEIALFDSGDNWSKKLGRDFSEEIRNEMVKQKIAVKEIHNDIPQAHPQPDGTAEWTDNKTYILNYYRHREIPTKVLNITQDVYIIGNEAVQLHGYRDNDIFGMEISSRELAGMVRQLFQMVWNQAKVVDAFGD